ERIGAAGVVMETNAPPSNMSKHLIPAAAAAVASLAFATAAVSAEPPPLKWLEATAYVVPKETCTEGEGYFSIIEGLNRRLYIGTHANGVNSWLVEFDPAARKMEIAVD